MSQESSIALPLSNKLSHYKKVLMDEFMKEFNFLADVVGGRATAKGDFTDKILKVMLLSSGAADKVLPGSKTVILFLQSSLQLVNDKIKFGHNAYIGHLYDEIDQTALRIIIEQVAHIASQRYAYFIANILADNNDEVAKFAKVGVERMLEYIGRKNLPVNPDILLQGLIEGRSGAYVRDVQNNRLDGKTKNTKLTAEGAYGRAAFRTKQVKSAWPVWQLTKKEWENFRAEQPRPKITIEELTKDLKEFEQNRKTEASDPITVKIKKACVRLKGKSKNIAEWSMQTINEQIEHTRAIHSHYGYTAFNKPISSNSIPKYGYIDVIDLHIDRYKYKEIGSQDFKTLSLNEFPQICEVDIGDVKDYLFSIQNNANNSKVQSFREFIKNTYGYPEDYDVANLAVYVRDLSKLESKSLSGGDFSGIYFQGTNLQNFDLKNTNFSQAYFWYADLSNADASGANFHGTHLEYSTLHKCDFTGADLSQTHMEFANLDQANLTGVKHLGSQWYKAKLETAIDTNHQSIKELQVKQKEQEELVFKELTAMQEQVNRYQSELKEFEQSSSVITNTLNEHTTRITNLEEKQKMEEKPNKPTLTFVNKPPQGKELEIKNQYQGAKVIVTDKTIQKDYSVQTPGVMAAQSMNILFQNEPTKIGSQVQGETVIIQQKQTQTNQEKRDTLVQTQQGLENLDLDNPPDSPGLS